MRKTIYIGEFPPPFGGVTVKNALLRDSVYNEGDVEFFNLYDCKKNPLKLLNLVLLIGKARREKAAIVLGIAYNIRLELAIKMISFIGGRRLVNRCVVYMMGSSLLEYCKERPKYVALLNQVTCILTESHKMQEYLGKLGLENVAFFPNCRVVEESFPPKKRQCGMPMKMVFFSKICREKGVDTLFTVVDGLKK